MQSTETLEELLSRPSAADIEALATLDGDILVLGAGGKMGPTLVQRAWRASQESGRPRQVFAVARSGAFPAGVRHIAADLLDPAAIQRLPDAPNIIYLVGRKFGSSGNEALTWATNAAVPVLVGARYPGARIVVLSTGNVYPFVAHDSGGATEATQPAPVGEYAQSALARERIFEYYAQAHSTKVAIMRLNYAVEPRYGVLVDIATKILNRTAIDLTMGYVNFIWQGDANSVCIRALQHCESPARVFNLTGTETHSVRSLAQQIGERLGLEPVFSGQEAETALLSSSASCRSVFGPPSMPVEVSIQLTLDWLGAGGTTLGKATHFETRSGRF
ncbi:NAD-dependent epimerase/dehydratase family protein [Paludibaculum fermentans]|uniref:NAD(P)-dependent oxidoreductase n=1 Tax=Paludibaculum fermentans TaxID=1473598 RepID=A0A7S7NWT9_PALFE|nr:NAD(P)-dependent oxidoreductase [Paludibaculum fermentans]QOY91261.1 NAD(P)-dependent oxidoreductase [Paludibaculum fermentans]